jgi:CelD/BcsL family acetyltransferase involved in cellulose biosynthesis
MISLDIVESLDGLLDLREEWDQLLERCSYRTPFYSPDWLNIWWTVFGSGFRLRILVLRDGDRLVGVAPLMFSVEKRGPLRIRKLGSVLNYYTPKADFLLAEQEEACLGQILEYCEGQSDHWDIVEFSYLPEDSGHADRLEALLESRGTPSLVRTSHESPYVRFEGGFEAYMKTRTRRFRRTLSNARNRLQKAGDHEFMVHRDGPEALDEHLENVFSLTLRSWKGGAGTAIGAEEALKRFYGEVAACWQAKGGLELRLLKVNGVYVASMLSLIEQGRVYTLKTHYDTQYRKLSPGNLIFRSLVEDHLNQGVEEIDFLAVRQSYLHRWCTGYRRYFNICMFKQKSPYSRLIYHLKKDLKPLYQSVRAKAGSLVNSNGPADT